MESLHIEDLPATIRSVKKQLRQSLPNYREVFEQVDAEIRRKVEVIAQERQRGEAVIPELQYADIAEGRVSAQAIAAIKDRGACVVRGVFSAERAGAWDNEIAQYLEHNRLARSRRASRRFTAFTGPAPRSRRDSLPNSRRHACF